MENPYNSGKNRSVLNFLDAFQSISSDVPLQHASTVPVTVPSVGSVSPTKQAPTTSASSTPIRRPANTDPNRVPLFVDKRLPEGWNRKESFECRQFLVGARFLEY